MVVPLARGFVCLSVLTVTAVAVSTADFDQYREFHLGGTVSSVSAVTGSSSADLKTMHERPALLQQLVWRPRYSAGRPVPDLDPAREMIFSFYDDQLFKIAVEYDESRTGGLTRDDMIAALSAIYGTQAPLASRPADRRGRVSAPVVTPTPLAQWWGGDTVVALSQSPYGPGFRLLVTHVGIEAKARIALATAIQLEARDAPAREAAERKKKADQAQLADEQARAINKGTFRP